MGTMIRFWRYFRFCGFFVLDKGGERGGKGHEVGSERQVEGTRRSCGSAPVRPDRDIRRGDRRQGFIGREGSGTPNGGRAREKRSKLFCFQDVEMKGFRNP